MEAPSPFIYNITLYDISIHSLTIEQAGALPDVQAGTTTAALVEAEDIDEGASKLTTELLRDNGKIEELYSEEGVVVVLSSKYMANDPANTDLPPERPSTTEPPPTEPANTDEPWITVGMPDAAPSEAPPAPPVHQLR